MIVFHALVFRLVRTHTSHKVVQNSACRYAWQVNLPTLKQRRVNYSARPQVPSSMQTHLLGIALPNVPSYLCFMDKQVLRHARLPVQIPMSTLKTPLAPVLPQPIATPSSLILPLRNVFLNVHSLIIDLLRNQAGPVLLLVQEYRMRTLRR